jgi:hypothetical protein
MAAPSPPKLVILFWIWWVWILFGVISLVTQIVLLPPTAPVVNSIISSAVGILVSMFNIVMLHRRRNWARILAIGLMVLELLYTATQVWNITGSHLGWGLPLALLVRIVVDAVLLLLLVHPSVSAVFTKRPHAAEPHAL